MTLAIILFFSTLGVPPAIVHVVPAAQSQSSSDQQAAPSPQDSPKTSEGTTEKTQSTSQSGSSTQTQTKKKPSKRPKKSSVNCNSSSTGQKDSKSNTSNSGKTSGSTAASPCPPKKVIVRQGSTTEPSIEVVGGAEGRQASDERNTAITMLEASEANLKKMEGTQLNSSQQDMVKQVREFMDQSKAATSAGDLDQARTLAWKAQLLSEELLKTQK